MKYVSIVKASIFALVCLGFLIPGWMQYYDNGLEKINVKRFISDDLKLSSNNLVITGRGLFDYACREEEYEDGTEMLEDVVWYVPFVPKNWNPEEEVRCILIFDNPVLWYDKNFKEAIDSLDRSIDSLANINDEITVKAIYRKYSIVRLKDELLSCLEQDGGLKLARRSSLMKLEFEGKKNLSGLKWLTGLAIILIIGIFFMFKE